MLPTRLALIVVSCLTVLGGCAAVVPPTATLLPTPTPTPSRVTDSPAPATTTAAASPAPTATPASPSVLRITLAGGKVAPNGQRVKLARGEKLTIDIYSDRADTVHVHGYDLEIELTPNSHVTRTLTLNQTGRFEVESHHPALVIAILLVS